MERQNLEREITVRLFQTSNALQTYLDNSLKEDSLTAKQFFMMIIIGTFGYNPKINEIAERFATSRQNVKQVLLKLEQHGFIELYKDETDSRITRTRFTEKALAYWSKRNDEDDQTMSTLYSSIPDDEMNVYLSSLLKTMEMIELLSTGGKQ
jgi:DNA-binding MarR family transcriptional regulator